MGDLSKDFSREEFACRCGCGFDCVDAELLRILQEIRDLYGRKLTITCGNRCPVYNRDIPGAAKNSMHTKGMAVDFRVEGIRADVIATHLEENYGGRYGIGRYSNRTHLDVRPGCARWDDRVG